MTDINLYGRVMITAEIRALTGLHIGGSSTGLEIGGLDNTIIRNPFDGRPYIPGSSLRGKMRSQTEKVLGLPQNTRIGQVTIHTCKKEADYRAKGGCPVCHVFGVPAEIGYSGPTRLIVRDTKLSDASADALDRANTELRYTEFKTEVTIDRVTSAAVPRSLERVPAGAVFAPAEFVYSIYEAADYDRFKLVVDALQLVEDDYLGGGGSRGNGKICFGDIAITARSRNDYGTPVNFHQFSDIQQLRRDFQELRGWLIETVPLE